MVEIRHDADTHRTNGDIFVIDRLKVSLFSAHISTQTVRGQLVAVSYTHLDVYKRQLLDKIRSTGTAGISADDKLAVEKLEAKLAGLKADQEHMKAVNAYYRKHKTLEGCPGLTPEGIAKLQASMARDWRKDPVPYPSFHLTNNNANILSLIHI